MSRIAELLKDNKTPIYDRQMVQISTSNRRATDREYELIGVFIYPNDWHDGDGSETVGYILCSYLTGARFHSRAMDCDLIFQGPDCP